MRRKDKEITDTLAIYRLLDEIDVVHIGINDGETPYIFAVNFIYFDGAIYLHSARDGKKIELIRKNSNVAFQMEKCNGIIEGDVPCKWTTNYQSLVGKGSAEFVDDTTVKCNVMSRLWSKFSNDEFKFTENMVAYIEIIKIDIKEITGKEMKSVEK